MRQKDTKGHDNCECCEKRGTFVFSILGYPLRTEKLRLDADMRLCRAHAREWVETWEEIVNAT